jgi:hypothetical protein
MRHPRHRRIGLALTLLALLLTLSGAARPQPAQAGPIWTNHLMHLITWNTTLFMQPGADPPRRMARVVIDATVYNETRRDAQFTLTVQFPRAAAIQGAPHCGRYHLTNAWTPYAPWGMTRADSPTHMTWTSARTTLRPQRMVICRWTVLMEAPYGMPNSMPLGSHMRDHTHHQTIAGTTRVSVP